ncbi:MAG: hypothetical protein IJR39_10600 [Treponema sp.]|nr:hypothetical protein [Treponema sp.]
MTIWKNGRKPPFMDSDEKDLNAEKIYFAVKQMTLEGLQDMTIYGLLILSKFKSPAEICGDIENLKSKKEALSWLKQAGTQDFNSSETDRSETDSIVM